MRANLTPVRILAASVCAMLFFGCHRFTNGKLVGTWRFEDDNEIEEMSLNEDHSFQSVTTYKNELSTPSSFPERGTWRVEGTELKIESASVYIPEVRKTRTGVVDLARGLLLVKNVDGTKSFPYRRLELPSCDDGSIVASGQTVREADLFGSWKIHYTTHDYQLRLMPNGQLAMLGFISDQWDPLSEGKWHIQGNHLIMDSAKSSSEADARPPQTWLVMRVGKDCFSIQDTDFSTRHTLQRVK